MAVRVDGLNKYLTTNREQFKDRHELKIFRAFLRQVFNIARNAYDSDVNASMPDGGDVLVQSLGVVSLNPLRNVVSEALKTAPPLPDLFDDSDIPDREEKRKSWRENTSDNIRNALGEIKYEKVDDNSFVKFRINDNSIVVNKNHPFVMEYSRTKAEKELMRNMAMVNFLTDVYALDIGIEPAMLTNMRNYRDKLMHFHALQHRKSGLYIARILLDVQHQSNSSRRLEVIASDALRYLGFDVRDLGKPGEPDGIASAFTTPTGIAPTKENPAPPLYSFIFDTKSSKNDAAQTNNIHLDAVVEHRNRYRANHALVIAPDFNRGAISNRCIEHQVTPMRASDLGRLLEYTAEYGAIPLPKLREVLKLYDPQEVTDWVENIDDYMKSERKLPLNVFLEALDILKGQIPDALAASTIALTCRNDLDAVEVMDQDVLALVHGLQIIVPDLVGIDDDKVVVNASSKRVAETVASQLERLHEKISGDLTDK